MTILMIGCGKMGGAMLKGWLNQSPDNFVIADPGLDAIPDNILPDALRSQNKSARKIADKIKLISGPQDLTGPDGQVQNKFDVIVIAVKPQMIDKVLPDYSDMLTDNGVFVSLAAGSSITNIQKSVRGSAVIRIMPNLPAAIGQGVIGFYAEKSVSADMGEKVKKLLSANGTVIDLKTEDGIDRLTAVAGSGPGYVFEIMRAYVIAAMSLGFDEDTARTLVTQTLKGSVALAESDAHTSLETLRNNVTSKAGTTEAGLDQLKQNDILLSLMEKTVKAAYNRAVELR